MKKTFVRLLAVLLAAALISGCSSSGGSEPDNPADENIEITFTDALDRTITLARPQRVAALMSSFADIWCLAGGHDTLVAAVDDAWTAFQLDLGDDVTDLGGYTEFSLELLLAAKPDLVLASSTISSGLEIMETLDQVGIPIAYFDVQTIDDYLDMLDICTELTGVTENYETYGTQVKEQVNEAASRQDGSSPTVLCLRASGTSCRVKGSDGNILGEMLADLGCINVADGSSLLEDLSLEAIMAADPDYIFAVLLGDDQEKAQANLETTLLSNPAWQSLRAVQEGHFYVMDHELYNMKPNARWGEAYEGIVDIIYPN